MAGNSDDRTPKSPHASGSTGGPGEPRAYPQRDGRPTECTLSPGELLDNRYFVTNLLPGCEAWRAYRVVDVDSRQEFVAQVLDPKVACVPDKMAAIRFVAELASQWRHENLANVVALSETGSLKYILLEYCRGETLAATVCNCDHRSPIATAHSVAKQVLSGLGCMHQNGFVHGRLGASNVLIAADGKVKLADAYTHELIAAATGERHARRALTANEAWHCSPEQLRAGGTIDKLTDVYLAGILFGYMWAGAYPINEATDVDIVKWHIDDNHRLAESIAPDLAKALARAVAVNKPSRWADCNQLAKALADAGQSRELTAPRAPTVWQNAACRTCGLPWPGAAKSCASCGASREACATLDNEPVAFVKAALRRIGQDVEGEIRAKGNHFGAGGAFGPLDENKRRGLNALISGAIATVSIKYSASEPLAGRRADFVDNMRCPTGNDALIALCDLAFEGGPDPGNFFAPGPNAARLTGLWQKKALEFYDELQVRARTDRNLTRHVVRHRLRASMLRRKVKR